MSKTEQTQSEQGKSKSFFDMTGAEKVKFLAKVVVFLCTGGFAFPTIWVD